MVGVVWARDTQRGELVTRRLFPCAVRGNEMSRLPGATGPVAPGPGKCSGEFTRGAGAFRFGRILRSLGKGASFSEVHRPYVEASCQSRVRFYSNVGPAARVGGGM